MVVRGNYGQIRLDLEMFYIVQFFEFLFKSGSWGLISAGCQFFYLVAFFRGPISGIFTFSLDFVLKMTKTSQKIAATNKNMSKAVQ